MCGCSAHEPRHRVHVGGSLPCMGSQDNQPDELADARAYSEPRRADLERREADLGRREADLGRREADHAERMNAAGAILAAADERDATADSRDAAAEKRENDLDRAEMLDPKSDYGAHWPERRHAALDRKH